MKKKSQRLQKIVELNANEEEKALQALGAAQIKKRNLQSQLDNLQKYQQEYIDKLQLLSTGGIKIDKLLEFKSFISKLKLAIEKQTSDILAMDQELNSLRQQWENKHFKTTNLQKVCDGAKHEEHKEEEKREQYEQDERATRIGRNDGMRNA